MNLTDIRRFLNEHFVDPPAVVPGAMGQLSDFLSWSPENFSPVLFSGGSFPDGITSIDASSCTAASANFSDAFTACTSLVLDNSGITALIVPATLQTLSLANAGSNVALVCTLPAALRHLELSGANYSALPALNNGLFFLNVSGCPNLPAVPALPASLTSLACASMGISALPALNGTALLSLDCNNCASLTALPSLPATLQSLNASASGINSLPALNGTALQTLNVTYCASLTTVPALPATLTVLAVAGTTLTTVPTIPAATVSVLAADCSWDDVKVNNLLAQLVAHGALNGYLDCSGSNDAPSGAGVANAATLVTRGWTVTTS